MKIFYLPDLGEGLAEAEVRTWYVQEGDTVKVDQPIVAMETAKAVVDVPSPYEGKITKLHGQINEVIPTGAPLVSFEDQEGREDAGSVVGKLESRPQAWTEQTVTISETSSAPVVKAMPAARVLAKELNVDLTLVKGSGPQGLITPDDVKQFHHHPSTAQSSSSINGAETLHGVRKVMAQMMTQSMQEVVPVTVTEDADVTGLKPQGDITVKLLQAMTAAAKEEPALNAWFDGKRLERKLFKEVNIGIAVDSPVGLFVPVIRDVASHSSEDLRTMLNKYKQAVYDRTLAPSEMQGATITLSNFGTITGRYATPIIMPPAVAILGCGRMKEVALVREGNIVAGRILPLSLSFDHRAVTGGEATRFLGAVIKYLLN